MFHCRCSIYEIIFAAQPTWFLILKTRENVLKSDQNGAWSFNDMCCFRILRRTLTSITAEFEALAAVIKLQTKLCALLESYSRLNGLGSLQRQFKSSPAIAVNWITCRIAINKLCSVELINYLWKRMKRIFTNDALKHQAVAWRRERAKKIKSELKYHESVSFL